MVFQWPMLPFNFRETNGKSMPDIKGYKEGPDLNHHFARGSCSRMVHQRLPAPSAAVDRLLPASFWCEEKLEYGYPCCKVVAMALPVENVMQWQLGDESVGVMFGDL